MKDALCPMMHAFASGVDSSNQPEHKHQSCKHADAEGKDEEGTVARWLVA
jgi:hypothetical protein